MQCSYHDRKFRQTFEFLSNRLRAKTIPLRLLPKLGRLVCCCSNGDDREITGPDSSRLSLIETWLKSHRHDVDNRDERVVQKLEQIFASVVAEATPARERVAKARLLDVLRKIENGDDDVCRCSDSKNENVSYVTDSFEMEVEWDLPSLDHVGLLIGKNGKNIDAIRSRFDQAKTEIVSRKWDPRLRMKFAGVERENVEAAVKVVREEMERIKENRRRHAEAVRLWGERQRMRRRRSTMRAGHYPSLNDEPSVKELARDVYETKDHAQYVYNMKEKARYVYQVKAAKKSKSFESLTRKKLGVLEKSGSLCLHCTTPFYKGRNGSGDCRYHSGYLVAGQWSCCQSESRDDDERREHAKHGCTRGRHVWRLGKEGKRRRCQKGGIDLKNF